MTPDLSIIIVSYNSRQDVARCLRSLQRFCTGVSMEIIVFDNASIDGTADMIASDFSEVHLIRHPENAGFARANNLAAAQARGRYLLLLNPDTWVDDDLGAALVRYLDAHPEADAIAPRVLLPDGSLQEGSVCALPTLKRIFYEQIGLSGLFPRSPVFGAYRMTHWDHDEVRQVEHATGACLAIRRQVYQQARGLDESFFMYIEDVEFSHRLKKLGKKTYYLPSAHVYHAGYRSGSRQPVENFLELYRSFYRYLRKHFSKKEGIAARLVFTLGLMLRIPVLAGMSLFQNHPRSSLYWHSRRQQLAGHVKLLLRHWSY